MIAWLLVMLAPVADDGYTYPPEVRGNLAATLTVSVPEGIGPPRIQYTLVVTGPPELEVEPPELADTAGTWSVTRTSAWSQKDNETIWTEEFALEQVKPGLLALPNLKVRFRAGPSTSWQEAEWNDILRETRELPGPSPPAAPGRNWPALLRAIAIGGATLLVLLALVRYLRRPSPPVPLTADARALAELHRLELSLSPVVAIPGSAFVQLSDIVRRYLAERFGLSAFQQTTTEFVRTVRAEKELAGETDSVRRIFEACDLSKFAGLHGDPDHWRHTIDLTRNFIRRTAPRTPAPVVPLAQEVPNRDARETASDTSGGRN